MATRIYFHEMRDFVKARARVILSLVIGAIWCFGFFGGYANAEDLAGTTSELKSPQSLIEKKVTIEDYFRREIIELEKGGHEEEARKTRQKLEWVIQAKREYSEKKEEERQRQSIVSAKHYKESFSATAKIERDKKNQWTPGQMIAFGAFALIVAKDAIQTGNIPPSTDPPIWHISEEQETNMSVEEIIEACNYDKYKEDNPLITSLFGKHPSGGEMFLYCVASTVAWFGVCHYGPRLYNIAREKVPAIRYIIPDIIGKNMRYLTIGAGLGYYSHQVLSNQKVTGKSIAVSLKF